MRPASTSRIREIVERAIVATGYVPNVAARSLVTGRTGSVALVISRTSSRVFNDPFFGRVGRAARGRSPRQHGVHLVLMPAEYDATRPTSSSRYLPQGHVDGVMLVNTHATDPLPRC